MTTIRTGTRALGLDTQWRYAFVGPGSAATTTCDAVYLDVGGALAPGVLDQHSGAEQGTASSALVLRHPELVYGHLVGPWLERVKDGRDLRKVRWEPVIVTHADPDFDAVVATFLVQRLVEDGGFPSGAEALIAYAMEVDLGRYRVDLGRPETATHAIHMAYLAIQHIDVDETGRRRSGPDLWTWRISRGLALLGSSLDRISPPGARPPSHHAQFHPGQPGVEGWRGDPAFADARELLDADLAVFTAHDLQGAGARQTSVDLPAADGSGAVRVPTFILSRPPASKLNKYWVRALGCPYFVCPYPEMFGVGSPDTVGGKERFPCVFLSLDPTWRHKGTGKKPTLQGLGYQLEQAETEVRRAEPGGDLRGRTPRYPDGSCDTDDPWYDGRDHEHTIVVAPRGGTRLTFERILQIATSRFWEVPLDHLALTLVFLDPCGDLRGPGTAIARPTEMSETLAPFLTACSDRDVAPPFQPPAGLEMRSCRLRSFPEGTCPPMLVVRLGSAPGDFSLDRLVAWCQELKSVAPDRRPVYLFARLRPSRSFAPASHAERLLGELGDGELEMLSGATGHQDLVLFNSRAVIVRGGSGEPTAEDRDLDLLLLLYAAFLNETMSRFSRRVTGTLFDRDEIQRDGRIEPEAIEDATRIREDFLHFQARYYQIDTTRSPSSRRLFDKLLASMNFAEHYAEVQSELDRLHQLEQRQADLREAQNERRIELLLLALGLTGIVQCGADVASLISDGATGWVLLSGSLTLCVAALVAYLRLRRRT